MVFYFKCTTGPCPSGSSDEMPKCSREEMPGFPHQRGPEGVQGVPQDCLHPRRRTGLWLVARGVKMSSYFSTFLSSFLFGSESNVSQVTKQIAKKVCKARGSEKCISIPRQVTVDVPKSIDKKVCRFF